MTPDAIQQAIALTYERSRYGDRAKWREELVLRLRAGLEGWTPGLPTQPFLDMARGIHAPDWPPDKKPKGCGCMGCRIHHVLSGGTIDPEPKMGSPRSASS